jgi:hypothetical protein
LIDVKHVGLIVMPYQMFIYNRFQGIQTRPSALSLRDVLVKHGHVSSAVIAGASVFLFVGSIRPVKDPLYLVNTMTGIICLKQAYHLFLTA